MRKSLSKCVLRLLQGIIHSSVHFLSNFPDVDVNERYIYNHTFVEELKSSISKVTQRLKIKFEPEDIKSSIIVILRITCPPQSCLSLAEKMNHILSRIPGPQRDSNFSRIALFLDAPRQIESKMKSARGVEYSKPTTRTIKKVEMKVGIHSPGVEFHQKVFSFPKLTIVL